MLMQRMTHGPVRETDQEAGGTAGDEGGEREGADRAGGLGESEQVTGGASEIAALRRRLAASEAQLTDARAALAEAGRQGALEAAMQAAGAIDAQAAALVAKGLPEMEGLAAEEAAEEVKRIKPFLFRAGGGRDVQAGRRDGVQQAMGRGMEQSGRGNSGLAPAARSIHGGGAGSVRKRVLAAADEARSSGRRDDLMKYMALRRSARLG